MQGCIIKPPDQWHCAIHQNTCFLFLSLTACALCCAIPPLSSGFQGITFDTYSNRNQGLQQYVSVIIGDGSQSYDHDKDGGDVKLAGCEVQHLHYYFIRKYFFCLSPWPTALATPSTKNFSARSFSTLAMCGKRWRRMLIGGMRLPVAVWPHHRTHSEETQWTLRSCMTATSFACTLQKWILHGRYCPLGSLRK